ncbi:MAG TPA: sugar phosphate isomerase/epimerase [Pirellulaceae bacterium]|nr:sugar phosphate isomerase/epimerase [Pirellulaceae bacterium]
MFSSLSRRRFLSLSAAAAAGATWFDTPRVLRAAGLADEKDPFGGFPVGVQSYSLRNFETPEVIRHLQGMGVHYTEFYGKHLDPKASDEQIAETLKLLQSANIKLAGHGVHGFSKNHEANKALFDFAKKAGVKVITANPEKDAFESLDKLVAEYDIRIAIHNHGPNALYDKLSDVTQAVKGHDKRIGACVDCGHYLRSGEDPVKCVLELGDRVYGVHIKDEKETNTPKSANVVIGKGHLDVVGLFKALKQIKFPADGALSLEYEANPMNPIDDMKACLEVAKEAIAKVA